MSPRTRITALNLGAQSIELAAFHAPPRGGLILQSYTSRDLPADPAQERTRQTRIIAALHDMLGELQIRGGPVNYTVAEESIFTRFVNLPSIDEEKIERIIAFEAQQNVPFPIDEVVWDYQLVGGGVGKQIQVILVAIKGDLLDEINGAVEKTGLRTSIVDLATMALYNAFRYNYADLSGCSLLVDIGARTTNLLFIEPGKIFTRSVPIGGGTVTSAIAKEFNEPFAAAEFRKKHASFVALAGAESGPSIDDVARVSRIMRSTMTRLHAELLRSVSHYCGQQQGQPPERIFLSGGGASPPSIEEFFREKLQLPTEFFNPLRNVAVAESVRADEILRSAHLLGEPVGLALRAATDCPMKLNLRPTSVVRRQEWAKRRPILMSAAACCILSLLGWGGYYAGATHVIRRQTQRIDEKIAALQPIESQLSDVLAQTAALDHVAIPLIAAINDRGFWPGIVEELNARLPKENIWITELVGTLGGNRLGASSASRPREQDAVSAMSPGPAGSGPVASSIDGLLVRGLYLFNAKQQEVVVDYFRNLASSPWFAIDPNNQAKVIKPTTPNDTEWAFPYELRLDLRQPVRLP